MKRSTIIDFSTIKISSFFRENKTLICLVLCFVAGIILGVVFLKKELFSDALYKSLFSKYSSEHFDLSFGRIFFNSLLLGFSLLTMCFICGTTMLGVILIPIFNILIGMYFGSIAAFVCNTYSFMGVAFNAVVLIPGILLLCVACMFAAKEALQFSFGVARPTFAKSQYNDLPIKFKGFCVKYLVFIFIIVFSALLDAFFSSSLSKIFDF